VTWSRTSTMCNACSQSSTYNGSIQVTFDLYEYQNRLSKDAKRIFLADDDPNLAVQVTEGGEPGK
jgi:hypothetical protein